jgi:hypothetical protein
MMAALQACFYFAWNYNNAISSLQGKFDKGSWKDKG